VPSNVRSRIVILIDLQPIDIDEARLLAELAHIAATLNIVRYWI